MFFEKPNDSIKKGFSPIDIELLVEKYRIIRGEPLNNKLNVLFINWLEAFLFLTKNKSLLDGLNIESIHNMDLFRIVEETNSRIFESTSPAIKYRRIKLLIGRCYLIFSRTIYLPGSNYLVKSFRFKFSQYSILYITNIVQIDYDSLRLFYRIISSLSISPSDKYLLKKLLPKEYFIKLPKTQSIPNLQLIGSPISLRDRNLVKLLAFENLLELTGVQHGCNYGLYKINKIEQFERLISEKYYLWLFSEYYVKISRYKNIINRNALKKSEIYWIGRPFVSKYFLEQIPALRNLCKTDNIDLIISHLRGYDFKLIPHFHPESSNYYKSLDSKYFFRPNSKVESYLLKSAKVLIFDTLNSTLIFFAIASSIPFLIISDDIEDDNKGESYDAFIDFLKSINSIFLPKDNLRFANELSKLCSDSFYYLERIKNINNAKTKIYLKSIIV